YIDTIAKDILPLHTHITNVNADAEFDALFWWHTGVSITHMTLQFGGAGDCVHDAWKLHQHSIAGQFDDSSLVLGDFGINEIGPQCVQCGEGARLVHTHEPAVANYIGGKDRS